VVRSRWEVKWTHSVQRYVNSEALRRYVCSQLLMSFICIICIFLLKLHTLAVAILCSVQRHHLSENDDETKALCRYGIELFLCTHELLEMHFWSGSMPWWFRNIQLLLLSWALINICPTINLLNVIQVRWAKNSQIPDNSKNIWNEEKKRLLFSIDEGLHC